MEIISKENAKKQGFRRYFTGNPCRRGHLSEKYVSDRGCIECAIERADRRYAAKKPEILDRHKSRYAEDPDKIKARVKARGDANPDKIKAERRREYQKHKASYLARAGTWQKANRDKGKQFAKNWATRNPDKARQYGVNRRMRLKQRLPSWLTQSDFQAIRAVYRKARRVSVKTGVPHQVDHIVPLQGALVSGLHVPWNLQVLTAPDNRLKSNRFNTV